MNPSSTEDYLDSLLRAVQKKDSPVETPEEELPEILELPKEEELPEILELPKEEELSEILELPKEEELSEILELPKEEELPEILELPKEEELPEILELPKEEELPEILELPKEEEFPETLEIPEESITDNLSIDGMEFDDELPSLEEVLGKLTAEEAGDLSVSDVQNMETHAERFDLDKLLGNQIEEEMEEAPVLTGQEMFADEIQNLSEEDIISLLQQSSDVESADDSSINALLGENAENTDLDVLLENLSEDSDIAGLQDLFEKSENNEPVSSEVEEMIELGLNMSDSDNLVEVSEKEERKQGLFSKLKGKIFTKKNKDENSVSDAEQEIPVNIEGEKNPEEFLLEEVPAEENADLNALFNFGEVSEFSESINMPEGTDSLKDLMAETGGLFFDGMQNNEPESFSFDQLFEDTSNVESDNSEMSDISDLLKSLESADGQSDIFAAGDDLFAEMDSEKGIETIEGLLEGSEEPTPKEKKPRLFARLITFLTAEDEEDDSDGLSKDGVEKLGVTSEENKEAMEQLDKEGDDTKKKKKKGKKGEPAGDDLDEDEEPQDDKKKKKKAKKEKKQKEPQPVEDINEPVLSKKKVRSTFLFAFTILAAILVCCIFIPDLFEKKSARNAFYDGDYETCYQALYGKKLSESDRLIFEKAGFMLALERRVDAYDNYMAVGDELRALESLMQEVEKQGEVMRNAADYELETEAEQSYQEVLQILLERYQISEEDVQTINGYKQDALFTLHLKAIVAGEEFVCPDYLREDGQAAGSDAAVGDSDLEETEEILEDILPAEEELTETEFEEGTN